MAVVNLELPLLILIVGIVCALVAWLLARSGFGVIDIALLWD
jgi:hypothetical protein